MVDPHVETRELVIVGAGAAGLATARCCGGRAASRSCSRPGRSRAPRGASATTGCACTRRVCSRGLPERRIPRRYGRWVARDDVIAYLSDYAKAERSTCGPAPQSGGSTRTATAWLLALPDGPLRADTVIVATGYNGAPWIPDWPGRDGFPGELVHSSEYRNPGRTAAGRLVVGAGNSGAEIATDLGEGGAASSRLSVRTPPQIIRRATAGIPAQLIGIAIRYLPPDWVDPISKAQRKLSIRICRPGACRGPRSACGPRSRDGHDADPRRRHRPRRAQRRGRDRRGGRGIRRRDVLLADGSRIAPDAVIAATGFRAGLDALVGHLDVLDARGLPRKTDGEPVLPGLWFVGFRPTLGGQLREGSIAARHVAAAVAAA